MEIKEWLRRGRWLAFEIAELEEARQRLFDSLQPSAMRYDKDVVQASHDKDYRREDLADLSTMIDKLRIEREKYSSEMNQLIATLPDSKMRTVMIAYYVNAKTFEQISYETNYSIRHIQRMHGEALKEFEKLRREQ